jgi:hypothetical protein
LRAACAGATIEELVQLNYSPFAEMTKNLWQWCGAVALTAAAICTLPAVAQQATAGGETQLMLSPHPTDAGKPLTYDPRFVAKSGDEKGCASGYSCRLRLLGVIQNNGVVELRATAFSW